MLLPKKMLCLLPDIPPASLSAYYPVPALCTSSSWRYFLCHAQEKNFEIFATKWQSEFEHNVSMQKVNRYFLNAFLLLLFYNI